MARKKEDMSNMGNRIDMGNGNWFNRIKQGNGRQSSGSSFWRIVLAIIAALAGIAGIIGILLTLGIIKLS